VQPRFDLGTVTVREEATLALALAGQDATFFLDKHATGDWGEGNPEQNERALREGSMVSSKYRTLRGHELRVVTFLGKRETYLFTRPNRVVESVPLVDLVSWGKPAEGEVLKEQPGNGSSRFDIGHVDMGGWVRIHASGNLPDDLPVFLSHTLAEWFRERKHLRLRIVVPICRDGNTVELHGFYEAHVFPPTPQAPQAIQ
jgi:hypothetical protein